MRKLKVLELFSGTRSVSKAFERRGHETFCVDFDESFEADWHADVGKITAEQIVKRFGHPDVLFASPECDSYSVAAISRHRRKDPVSDTLIAVSEYAKECDRVNVNLMRIIRDLRVPLIWIENPRGGMRKADWLQWCPRHTVTYCSYTQDLPPERRRMKPTDIFTNHPNPGFLPPCKNGDPCHARAPRGARTGTQGLKHEDRIRIPDALCDHIVLASEDYTARLDAANAWLVENGMEPLTIQWPDVDGQAQERLF